jgi:hypothetical protein
MTTTRIIKRAKKATEKAAVGYSEAGEWAGQAGTKEASQTQSEQARLMGLLSGRNLAAATEQIVAGDIMIEREAVVNMVRGPDGPRPSIAHDNTYRVWVRTSEPTRFEVVRTGDDGIWGRMDSQKPETPIASHREAVEWELQQWAKAVAEIRERCVEVTGGAGDGTFETCGTVRVWGNLTIRANMAVAAVTRRT